MASIHCLLHADEKDYLLHDEHGEELYGMSLPQSIERAQAKPLFQVRHYKMSTSYLGEGGGGGGGGIV
jgi:hypothetical protein